MLKNNLNYYRISYNDKTKIPCNIKFNNIGDPIQSLAIKKLYQKININSNIVPVESLHDSTLDKNNFIILNGYLGSGITKNVFNKKFKYEFISSHFWDIDKKTKEDFLIDQNKYIGCRDWYTYNKLKNWGIKSYLSFCMTLTFDFRDQDKKYDTIFVNEIDDLKWISFNKNDKIQKIDNNIEINNYSWQQLEQIAENRLNLLKNNAKLVITRRIHTYFPCIAMGIPCIYVGPNDIRIINMLKLINLNTIYYLKPLLIQNFNNIILNNDYCLSNVLNDFSNYLIKTHY